ncbi:YqaJ-like viral recombinase [Tardibacter chloracetimidivorans]|uniref:YqaJ-like viral recombinase n=1 Tax=Tardibacter chloracetimidivorans TaxID=1921510 RepID=A0A1L3ZR17_9SPHN|nr:YqaJ viral recombinase family protein [Tardibacter chloracetimidivorans]API58069.1 YqaJ-like viral recombinase [Tardibacter chloracetimidivorans]
MGITHYPLMIQGSDEWLQIRCGLLTASEMKLIVTPTLKIASNDKERAHLYELLAQRITGYVEPHYVSDDMLRGQDDEIEARALYAKNYALVQEMGFITNDRWGFTIGYSPDGLVGDDGAIEAKSRRQKYQVQTVIENLSNETVPADFAIQLQTGLLVSERRWIDFISYSGGLPMAVIRVFPDPIVQDAIVNAAGEFEARLLKRMDEYHAAISARKLVQTKRRVEQEMYV